jgi:hypothetical protein
VYAWRDWTNQQFLDPRADHLVARCWLWALGATVLFVPLGFYAAKIVFFFPQHRATPPLTALIVTTGIALASAFGLALVASVLLAFRQTRWLAGIAALAPLPIAGLLAIGYLLFGVWPVNGTSAVDRTIAGTKVYPREDALFSKAKNCDAIATHQRWACRNWRYRRHAP